MFAVNFKFWIFSTKKNRTPGASLLVVGGVQKGPRGSLSRCEQPLQAWVSSWDPCRVLRGCELGQLSAQFKLIYLLLQRLRASTSQAPFHSPPFSSLQKPSDGGFHPPTAPGLPHSACYVCQSVADIRETAMDKYSFEFCPSFCVSAFSWFCLKLSVNPFPPLFLHGPDEGVRSTWG